MQLPLGAYYYGTYCLLPTAYYSLLTAHQVQLLLGSLAVVAAFSTLLLPERRGLALPD